MITLCVKSVTSISNAFYTFISLCYNIHTFILRHYQTSLLQVITLVQNLKDLVSYVVNLVKDHLNIFNLKSDDGIKQLQKHIQ